MLKKLNEKDIRTLKMGAIGVVAILILLVAMKVQESWSKNREDFAKLESQLNAINIDQAKRARLMSAVPVFEMPRKTETQKEDFRNMLVDQFDRLGIITEPWQDIVSTKILVPGYDTLRLKSSGTCRFEQILDLLAALKENPYLVGIEEMHFECDPQNPQQVEFNLTVSTVTSK